MKGYLSILNDEIQEESDTTPEAPKNLEQVNASLNDFEENMKKLMEATHHPSPSNTTPLSMPDPSEILKQMNKEVKK